MSDGSPLLLRPLTLEYIVTGQLDGSTPAPAFDVPPSPDAPVDSDQILRQTVENLGLVNLTGGGPPGAFADRLIKWILIYGPNVPFADDTVAVAFDGVTQRVELEIPPAANGVYSRICVLVPQTGQLRLNGMMASATEPVVVRMGVWRPQTVKGLAAMLKACCCTAECVDAAGNPCFAEGIYSDANCDSRSIDTVETGGGAPVVIARSAGDTAVVTGAGFTASDVWRVFDGDQNLLINQVNFLSSNTVELVIAVQDDAPVGGYSVSVMPPAAGAQCTVIFPDGVEVTL